MKSNLRNEIKSYIVRSGYTMQEVVDRLSEDYSWSDSVSNLSNKLQRESLRYVEQFCDAGADLVTVHVESDTEEKLISDLAAWEDTKRQLDQLLEG